MAAIFPEKQPQPPSTNGTDAQRNECASQNAADYGTSFDPSLLHGSRPGLQFDQRPAHNIPGPYAHGTFNSSYHHRSFSSEKTVKCGDLDPRRYRGYPAMCTWMASDDDFFVLRRFSQLSARVALLMQNRIVRLEEIVYAEDAKCMAEDGDNGSFDLDGSRERLAAMDELVGCLEQYQRFVLDHSTLKARPDATKRQILNVKNWLQNNNQPIRLGEVSFIHKEGDLMPMVPRVKPPLRRFLDRIDMIGRISFFRRKEEKYDQRHFQSETTIYNMEGRIDKIVTCVTIVLGLVMLIAPMWVLQIIYSEQPDLKARLAIITTFLVVFTLLLSTVAVARPFEVLAATAAYGAVLMVFMQLGDPGKHQV